MDYTVMCTMFIQTAEQQEISLNHSGNQSYISITAKSDDWRNEDGCLDGCCSPCFDQKEAFEAYISLVRIFGRGCYSWEQRKKMVRECNSATIKLHN